MLLYEYIDSNIKIAHRNKTITSKSKTRKSIAIIKNLIEKGLPISMIGLNPHSYIEFFSLSDSFVFTMKYIKTINIVIKNIINIKIKKCFVIMIPINKHK